ncbi:MAG: hypothetical protein L3J22_00975 [Xanthomonadales bacterium]|nr:hypothetical protein [Xanthomonadales bacterium]
MTITEKIKWSSFALFLILCLTFEPVLQLALNENIESALLVYFYIFIVALVCLLLITLIGVVSTPLYIALMASFIAFSTLELKLIYTNTFSGLESGYLGLFLICLTVVLLLFVYKKVIPPKLGISFYLVTAVILVFAPLITIDKNSFGSEVKLTTAENQFLQQLSAISFEQKPNVYLLAFDSMIPPYVAKKYLDIDQLPYQSAINKSFIDFEFAASIGVPTKRSLNGLMRLDQTMLSNSRDYFNGMKPSALGVIFKQNGYELTTGYATYYFGKKGKHVDRYVIGKQNTLSKTVQCLDIGDKFFYILRAYGGCSIIGKYKNSSHFVSSLFGAEAEREISVKFWPEKILEEVRASVESSVPKLKIFYSYRPNGHVKKSYRHTDINAKDSYKNYFLSSAEQLNNILKDLVDIINKNDPTAIVVVFGDHGAWLSRGITADENPEFFYEDRHLVSLSALKTSNKCSSRGALMYYSAPYNTPSRLVSSIVRCLANEKSELDKALEFKEPKPIIQMLLKLENKD